MPRDLNIAHARLTIITKIRDLTWHMVVWFYEIGIANILSPNNIKKKYHLTNDNAPNNCFEVHKENGTKCVFMPSSKKELFYSSVNDDVATALV